MANYTQKAILQTFEDMLEEMPFGKITVSALVARCGISSNTFYYHFKDIYDLLDVWLDSRKEQLLGQTEDQADWAAQLKIILHEMKKNPAPVYHVFDALSRERLERYIFGSLEEEFYALVRESADGADIPDKDIRMISSFCCYSLLGFFLRFLWDNMETDVDSTVDHIFALVDGMSEFFVSKYSGKEDGPAPAPGPDAP